MSTIDLTQLKADFDRDGYVIIRDFIPMEEIEKLRKKADTVLSRLQAPTGKTKEKFGNIHKGLNRQDSYFNNLMENGPHVSILESLLGEKPTPSTTGFFDKEMVDQEVYPHPDGDNGATIWMALDPTNPENGCLHFLRGSHLEFGNFGHLTADRYNNLTNDPDAVAAILNPGDVSIHNSRTIHWSGKNTSGEPRRGVNIFYQRRNEKFSNTLKKHFEMAKA